MDTLWSSVFAVLWLGVCGSEVFFDPPQNVIWSTKMLSLSESYDDFTVIEPEDDFIVMAREDLLFRYHVLDNVIETLLEKVPCDVSSIVSIAAYQILWACSKSVYIIKFDNNWNVKDNGTSILFSEEYVKDELFKEPCHETNAKIREIFKFNNSVLVNIKDCNDDVMQLYSMNASLVRRIGLPNEAVSLHVDSESINLLLKQDVPATNMVFQDFPFPIKHRTLQCNSNDENMDSAQGDGEMSCIDMSGRLRFSYWSDHLIIASFAYKNYLTVFHWNNSTTEQYSIKLGGDYRLKKILRFNKRTIIAGKGSGNGKNQLLLINLGPDDEECLGTSPDDSCAAVKKPTTQHVSMEVDSPMCFSQSPGNIMKRNMSLDHCVLTCARRVNECVGICYHTIDRTCEIRLTRCSGFSEEQSTMVACYKNLMYPN